MNNINFNLDLEGFSDVRIRTIAYYFCIWYNDTSIINDDRRVMFNLYTWFVREKPTFENIMNDIHRDIIIEYIEKYYDVHETNAIELTILYDIICSLKERR